MNYLDQMLHHQNWVSGILQLAVLKNVDALELLRKEIKLSVILGMLDYVILVILETVSIIS